MNREGGSYWKKGRGQGAKGKIPFLFLPSPVKQGIGRKAQVAPRPAASGHVGGHGEGKRERESRWVDSPT